MSASGQEPEGGAGDVTVGGVTRRYFRLSQSLECDAWRGGRERGRAVALGKWATLGVCGTGTDCFVGILSPVSPFPGFCGLFLLR